jgi:DNA-binding NtrC family response regulator
MRLTAAGESRSAVAVPTFGQLVDAFQEVAAGVEGTHRALIERVEQLTRELEVFRSRSAEPTPVACDGNVTLETIERQVVVATLERFGGHRDRSAKALGIGVRTLGMKLRQWKDAGLVPEHL